MMSRRAVALLLLALPLAAHAADPKHGSDVFDDECSDCHNATAGGANGRGPNLYGVVGRRAGTVPGFSYSDANLHSRVVWSTSTLDPYLTDPAGYMPGTAMRYKGLKDASARADLLAFLASLH